MRLRIDRGNASQGVFYYHIWPDIEGSERDSGEAIEHLLNLAPRVEAMAQRELGGHFVSLITKYGEFLELQVRVGTTKEKRFELQSLFGWIRLFDTEVVDA